MDRSFTQYDRFLRLIGGYMNFRKLLTYLTVGTAAVIPFAGAQNPTILQGSYISNVFGNSNFVLNPNAQTNIANVTTVTATVARSTTTPLVATSEFTVAIGTANGTATWATRAFDAGMKGQNCEARFSYRGFAATSKVHIKQGANTVASLNLTPATDPRIASINFPCGDLSNPTTFQVTDTAILAGTNEIGGIYVGLATNMANVAQAEVLVRATVGTSQSIPNNAYTKVAFDTETLDVYNEFNTTTNTFTAKRAGQYFITATYMFSSSAWAPNANILATIVKNGSETMQNWYPVQGSYTNFTGVTVNQTIDLAVGDTIWIGVNQNSGGAKTIFASTTYGGMSISRFPSSSELVVTPERQNTFAGIKGIAAGVFTNSVTAASWTKLTSGTTLTRTAYGKAKVETNNDYSITVENMPVGSYFVSVTNRFHAAANGIGDRTVCSFGIADTATGGAQISGIQVDSYGDASAATQAMLGSTMTGIYVNSSVANRTFFVQATRLAGLGECKGYSASEGGINIIITPLDQPSNSALYVQGPVLGAQTGAAIPASYVGEELFAVDATGQNTTSATYNTLSLALTPGVWDVNGSCRFDRNGATFTYPNFIASIVNQNANPFETVLAQLAGPAFINSDNVGLATPTVRVRWDGVTNITYGSNNTSSNLIYVRCFPGIFTGGPVTVIRRVRAVRVN
jgi:hypothetical protein